MPFVGLVVVAGLLFSAMAAMFGGAAAPIELSDAGPVVRWGIPLLRVVHDLAAALTVGMFLLGGLLMPEGKNTQRRAYAGRLATASATVWGLAGLLGGVMAYSDLSGTAIGSSGFFSAYWTNTWQLELLRAPAITSFAALVIALLSSIERGRNAMAWLFFASVVAILPLALVGHAAGSADHDSAVNSLAFHLVGATIWVGGLLALLLLWSRLGKGAAATAARYSRIALWCFVLVALSGLLNAAVRLGGFGELTSDYGILVLAKTAALVVLGGFGYLQRERVIRVLERSPDEKAPRGAFARFAALEVLVMGATVGIATALARTPPPGGEEISASDPVLDRTGYPTPPDFTVTRLLTMWRTEWLFTTVAVIAIGVYLAWMLRLRRRGDSWPIHRTICWVAGWLLFVYVIDSGIGIYGRVMFSIHMIEHMIISMGVPLLLVLGAPVTLALRALPKRKDATLGPRELILATVHSRATRFFGNPVVAAVLFFFSLVVFYYSPLFGLALQTHTGHVLMIVHFLLTGYLFVWSLIGVDPGPPKLPAPLRLLVLLVTLASHAFFGVALMTGTTLLVPEFFNALQLPWVPDPLDDQQAAGAVAWGTGELPTVILAVLVTADWLRSDNKEARRQERQAERDDDADLKAYNEYLAGRAGRGGPPKE
ncbi:putative copper resistance protein D [Barrientosiimonas humi]|uniref:Putative copper resistance protein D n=1 Tax=Barrientosiimonas humi TaxID=999931 RepID=A0A542WZB0_9MICO|nr:cytochrome c oxidase assembly protein [Barrientosiimonas humi]TQL28921.1 putative copper resistance protein D [Barrientosiimonas humi]CAG7571301.1 Inner membrane protein YebZ [Barrientosiimonas humi]